MHNCASFFMMLLFFPCVSCGFWAFPPLRVLNVGTDQAVEVEFSDKPSQTSIRRAFKLTEDGITQNGTFGFAGNAAFFYPEKGLTLNHDYEVIISTAAESERGNSLAENYVKRFTTRSVTAEFSVAGISPADTGLFSDERDGIVLTFSSPVDREHFTDAVRFSPSFSWLGDFTAPEEVRILPAEPLAAGKRYVLELDSSLADIYGNRLKTPFSASFTFRPDTTPPDFTLRAAGYGFLPAFEPGGAAVLPSDAELVIEFSEPVKIEALQSLVTVLPPLAVTVETDRESRCSARIALDRLPVWGCLYTLTVQPGMSDLAGNTLAAERSFRFVCSLEKNRLPQVLKAFFDLYPDADETRRRFTVFSPDEVFGTLSLDPVRYNPTLSAFPVPADLYVVVRVSSESKTIPLVSAMRNVRIAATNGSAIFSLKKAAVFPADDARAAPLKPFFDAEPVFSGDGKLMVLRFSLEVENRPPPGFVTLSVAAGLGDDLGNESASDWSVTLNKN